jgi:predicted metal-dependent hydrolase
MQENLEQIKTFYEEAFAVFDSKRKTPEISVEFYDYIGINHTIRVRDGKVFVRLAEICRAMPLIAHKGLAFILVAKLLRKRVPTGARTVYSNYIKSAEIQAKAKENKRTRGKKIITSAKGEFYDLDGIFEKNNQIYFQNSIPKPVLSWSTRKTYRILGHHDATHETIIISKSLDDKNVPKYVVEYIVFHEMLHIFHPTQHRNGRRFNHTPAFRRDERKFLYFTEAENWIERNAQKWKSEKAEKRKSWFRKS